jgi:membrane protein implicated in regulation of membrane protease activity
MSRMMKQIEPAAAFVMLLIGLLACALGYCVTLAVQGQPLLLTGWFLLSVLSALWLRAGARAAGETCGKSNRGHGQGRVDAPGGLDRVGGISGG